jgi:hypothetical protein
VLPPPAAVLQPKRTSKLNSMEEHLRSLSADLLAWLADNPKSIISGGANSRTDKVYAQLGADKFRAILDTPSTLTIEDAFTQPSSNGGQQQADDDDAAPAAAAAAPIMDIVPSSSFSSGGRGKRALAEANDDDNNMAIVAVNQLAAEFRHYFQINEHKHGATSKRLEDLGSQVAALAEAVRSSAAAQHGNVFMAPTMATTTMAMAATTGVQVEVGAGPPGA